LKNTLTADQNWPYALAGIAHSRKATVFIKLLMNCFKSSSS